MPDVDTRTTFYKLLLDKSKADSKGTAYKLFHMKDAQNFYESGELVFRSVQQ
jgi:hypothetical protein